MQFVLVAIGVAGITVLLWKALRPQRPDRRPVLAPDDDPEFLSGLNRQRQHPEEDR